MKFMVPFIMFLTGMNCACALPSQAAKMDEQPQTRNHEHAYPGNIYGTISDESSGTPVKNATIYVTDTPVQYLTQTRPGALDSDQGPVILPDLISAVCQASSGDDGEFIVNDIPIPGSSRLYTVIIKAEGRDATVIDQVLILPGASMALRIDCRMTSEGRVRIIKILKGHGHVDINYNDELRKPIERDLRQ
jgi:hypothetical protein